AYMNALWLFLFGFLFYRYGSTRVLRAALGVMCLALLIRMVFGFINYYADHTYPIPVINYSIDPQDLRASGLLLFSLGLVLVLVTRGGFSRVAYGIMTGVAAWAVMLGGSRGGIALLLFI